MQGKRGRYAQGSASPELRASDDGRGRKRLCQVGEACTNPSHGLSAPGGRPAGADGDDGSIVPIAPTRDEMDYGDTAQWEAAQPTGGGADAAERGDGSELHYPPRQSARRVEGIGVMIERADGARRRIRGKTRVASTTPGSRMRPGQGARHLEHESGAQDVSANKLPLLEASGCHGEALGVRASRTWGSGGHIANEGRGGARSSGGLRAGGEGPALESAVDSEMNTIKCTPQPRGLGTDGRAAAQSCATSATSRPLT